MSYPKNSALCNTYLFHDTPTETVAQSFTSLCAIGTSCVPDVVHVLCNHLRQYRPFSYSQSAIMDMYKTLEKKMDISPQDAFWSQMKDQFLRYKEDGPKDRPGISIFQRLASRTGIRRASDLIERLGQPSLASLCSMLSLSDRYLAMTAAAVICSLDCPSPYLVKAIVASPNLHLDLALSPEIRITYYLLIAAIARSGDDLAKKELHATAEDNGLDMEDFENEIMDSAIYLISISKKR